MKSILNRKIVPELKDIEEMEFPFPEIFKLDNGIPVYLTSSGEQEVIKIEFVFNAGIRHQSVPLVAKLTADMLTEGTENYSAGKIADMLDYYSVFVDKNCDRDKSVIEITCLNKHLENILPVLKDIIISPVFPENELSLLVQNKKQQFILNNEKVNYLAKQKFKEMLFGPKHPYGSMVKLENYGKLNKDYLSDFHKNQYSSSECWIMISGKPDNNIINLLNKFFGKTFGNLNLKSEQRAVNKIELTSSSKQYIEKPGSVQSAVRIGKILFNYSHPDYYSFKILNTVLGGYFGSRLMTNIREDKGYTYGIGSNLISLHNSAYFFISSQIGTEYCNMAVNEIYKEIRRLQEEKIADSELDLVRNYMQGNFLRSIDGPFAYAEICKILIEYKLDKDYFSRYINTIQTITKEELLDTAQKYLDSESMIELVVGKR